MKRMYVTLAVMFILCVGILSALAQKLSGTTVVRVDSVTPSDDIQKRMQMHEQFHQRLRQKLMYGDVSDEDLFQGMDDLFERAFTDAHGRPKESGSFQMEWSENSAGRVLVITPQSPQQKLDLSVNKEVLTIKGQNETKTPNGMSMSNFTNSFPVPGDCDGSKVKINQKEGKLIVEFPFRSQMKKEVTPKSDKEVRMPLPPSEEDVTI